MANRINTDTVSLCANANNSNSIILAPPLAGHDKWETYTST